MSNPRVENHPETLEKLARTMGCEIKCSDVFPIDGEFMSQNDSPKAYLLVFPMVDYNHTPAGGSVDTSDVWFTKQYLPDTCGSIGMLHTLCNMGKEAIEGSFLDVLKKDVKDMNPEERGEYIKNNEKFLELHNKAAAEGSSGDGASCADLHFVAFVVIKGDLFELDGRYDKPINHGPASTIQSAASSVITEKYFKNSQDMRFSIVDVQ